MNNEMLCWPLFGVGLDKLGCGREPCQWRIPKVGSDQLLVRIDAIGLCFSDIKMIRAGEDHPRVHSRDLSADPVIPGHEAVMTVVEAGSEDLAAEYPIGSRYIIQADIYVNGVGYAYGYAINGGMAQYSIIDQRVLNGDEGSYLLPLADHVPAAVAALIEPWTCVIASYMIEHRTRLKSRGRMLAAMEPGHDRVYTLSTNALAEEGPPAIVDCLNLNRETLRNLEQVLSDAKFNLLTDSPNTAEYDDIILCGIGDESFAGPLSRLGATDALISFVGGAATGDWTFDVGSIHYKSWFYQGTESNDIGQAYGRNVRAELCSGGTCWLLGGAGAMGQMHTQLAVENENGPRRILVTDLDDGRIAKVTSDLASAAAARGVELKTMNPRNFASEGDFLEAVGEFAPEGFDDIIMLVPSVPVVNSAVKFLAEDGLMNIFAGIPAGEEAVLDVGAIAGKGVRYIGSSGSRTYHLRHTLNLVETGDLRPVSALAAIGGMRVLREGLEGVAEGRYPGKTVIFPHCEHLPLTSVEELSTLGNDVAASLKEGGGDYNMTTEKAIFAEFGTR